jgi:TonB family protein
MKDSVNWILTLGEKRTAKSSDARLVKRNNEVWTNLREQLKNQRSDFKVPPFRKLEDYEEKPLPDSTKIIAFKDSIKVSSSPDTITASKDRPPISLVPGLRERRFNPTGIPQPILVGGNQALQEYIETQGLFPDSAKQANIDRGLVMVEVTVDTSGNAIDFKIIDAQPENMGFEELALQALRAMKYEPTVLEGVKVEGVLRQPVVFSNQED